MIQFILCPKSMEYEELGMCGGSAARIDVLSNFNRNSAKKYFGDIEILYKSKIISLDDIKGWDTRSFDAKGRY